MAPETTAVPMQVNSTSTTPVDAHRYELFYDQLFRLRDAVFAGKHPHFKLPDSVLATVAAHPDQTTAFLVPRPTTNGFTNGPLQAPAPVPYQNGQTPAFTAPKASGMPPSNLQHPPIPKPSSSGLDPIFLEKSEDLIKAELQLKRQRIERVLREAVDRQRKNQFRDKDFGAESDSVLDVSAILAKAHELVKPISGLKSPENRSASSDSFDENSYYSSQANSWSTEDVENVGADDVAVTTDANGEVGRDVDATASNRNGAMHPYESNIPRQHGEDLATQRLKETPHTGLQHSTSLDQPQSSRSHARAQKQFREEREESEYSPPAVDAFSTMPQTELHVQLDNLGAAPPFSTIPIIQNHIQFPVAPQPARVSPLAMGKLPRVEQPHSSNQALHPQSGPSSPRTDQPRNQRQPKTTNSGHASGRDSRRQSPNGPRQPINNPRKRRRGHDGEDGHRRASGKRVARSPPARSPEPYIKEEPLSPVPFASLSDHPPVKRGIVHALPDDVEIISPRDIRTRPFYVREVDPSGAYRYYEEEPVSPGYVMVHPRTTSRRVDRDDHDLRRVASLQYARRPYSPYQAVPHTPMEARPVRAASLAYVERQPPIHPEDALRLSRYIRSERSQSPPYVVESYPAQRQSSILMAPPPRPVIVDEYGNEYYAAPPRTHQRVSAAPPVRHVEGEPYYERAPTREPPVRLPARAPEPYYEDGAAQRMPMPPPPRRLMEPQDVEMVDQQRAYPPRAYSVRPAEAVPVREEYLPPREALDRRPLVYYDDVPPPPRDPLPRAYSVRPDLPRREPPPEYLPRHESAAPGREYIRRVDPAPQGYREASVVHRGEFVPVEERRYGYAPPPPQHQHQHQPLRGGEEQYMEVVQEGYGEGRRGGGYRY